MSRHEWREGTLDREQVGRESALALLRRPVIQGLLAITALAQVVNVQANEADRWGLIGRDVAQLAPLVVTPEGLKERQLEEEAKRLAAEYREQGFPVSSALAMQIGEAAAEYEIEPATAFGLVRAESSFRNAATSRVGAVGLTQLMPRTAAWIEPGVTRGELRDPETNLRVGFKYLRYLLDKYEGNERLALLAYNRGPGTVDRALRRGRDPDNGYADFVYGKDDHGHRLFTR